MIKSKGNPFTRGSRGSIDYVKAKGIPERQLNVMKERCIGLYLWNPLKTESDRVKRREEKERSDLKTVTEIND